MPGEGPGAAVRSAAGAGRRLAVASWRASRSSGAAGGQRVAAACDVVPAAAGDCGAVGGVGSGGSGWVGRHGVWGCSLRSTARRDALDREQDAIKARAKERGQTELAEQRLYDVRMNLVQRYWEDSEVSSFSKGSLSCFRPTRAASIAAVSSGSTGNESISSGHITLKGHTDGVKSVAFSPDGRASPPPARTTVKVWDTRPARKSLPSRGTPRCHERGVQPRRQAARLRQLRQTVKLWDAAMGRNSSPSRGTPALSRRGVQPGRPSARLRQRRPDGEGLGRGHRARNPHPQGAQRAASTSVAFSPDGRGSPPPVGIRR